MTLKFTATGRDASQLDSMLDTLRRYDDERLAACLQGLAETTIDIGLLNRAIAIAAAERIRQAGTHPTPPHHIGRDTMTTATQIISASASDITFTSYREVLMPPPDLPEDLYEAWYAAQTGAHWRPTDVGNPPCDGREMVLCEYGPNDAYEIASASVCRWQSAFKLQADLLKKWQDPTSDKTWNGDFGLGFHRQIDIDALPLDPSADQMQLHYMALEEASAWEHMLAQLGSASTSMTIALELGL